MSMREPTDSLDYLQREAETPQATRLALVLIVPCFERIAYKTRRPPRPLRLQSPRLYGTVTLATLRVAVIIACVFGDTAMKLLQPLVFVAVACEAMAQDAQCVIERNAMVETIRAYAQSEVDVLGPQGISERVLAAMQQTERHWFIPGRSCSVAYMDAPVRIGEGQTISQPFMVAPMTHLAALKVDDTVLEVGTGSGYQAAVLARLVRRVCTVEIIQPLAEAAAKVLGPTARHPVRACKSGDEP
jgi:hypothetical protein